MLLLRLLDLYTLPRLTQDLNFGSQNQNLATEIKSQKISYISYNRLAKSWIRDFEKRNKKNIVKFRSMAKTAIF